MVVGMSVCPLQAKTKELDNKYDGYNEKEIELIKKVEAMNSAFDLNKGEILSITVNRVFFDSNNEGSIGQNYMDLYCYVQELKIIQVMMTWNLSQLLIG